MVQSPEAHYENRAWLWFNIPGVDVVHMQPCGLWKHTSAISTNSTNNTEDTNFNEHGSNTRTTKSNSNSYVGSNRYANRYTYADSSTKSDAYSFTNTESNTHSYAYAKADTSSNSATNTATSAYAQHHIYLRFSGRLLLWSGLCAHARWSCVDDHRNLLFRIRC